MSNFVKILVLGVCGYFGAKQMGWIGEGSSDLPKSMNGFVRQAKVLDRKLVVLLTGSDWCGACKSMEANMLRTSEWQNFATKEIVFQKFEYPSGGVATTTTHQELMKLPGVRGFPTMVVVNSSGKILDQRVGYGGGADDYIQWIKSL